MSIQLFTRAVVGTVLLALFLSAARAQSARKDYRYDGLELAEFAAIWEQSRAQGGLVYGDENVRRVEYFTGFVNGAALATLQRSWCPREEFELGQIWGVVAKYLREHPEHWSQTPATLVQRALAQAFPC